MERSVCVKCMIYARSDWLLDKKRRWLEVVKGIEGVVSNYRQGD